MTRPRTRTPNRDTLAARMRDPAHPLWSMLRLTVMLVALVVMMMLTPKGFSGETVVQLFLITAGVEGGTKLVKRIVK